MELWFWLAVLSAVFGSIAVICKKYALKKEHSLEYIATFKFFELLTVVFLMPFLKLDISVVQLVILYLLTLFSTLGPSLIFI